MRDRYHREFKHAWADAKEKGFGLMDMGHKVRIDPEKLAFLSPSGKYQKMRSEIQVRTLLRELQKIYEKKFAGHTDPYSFDLLKLPDRFFERLARAGEICTLKYVLGYEDGGLNIDRRSTIIKGKKHFVWESGGDD